MVCRASLNKMPQIYDSKTVKKELSGTSALDRMKNVVLDVLSPSIWEHNVERFMHESHFNQVGIGKDAQGKAQQGQAQRHDCKWEEMAKNIIKMDEIPESKKNMIYNKWEQMMNENFNRRHL